MGTIILQLAPLLAAQKLCFSSVKRIQSSSRSLFQVFLIIPQRSKKYQLHMTQLQPLKAAPARSNTSCYSSFYIAVQGSPPSKDNGPKGAKWSGKDKPGQWLPHEVTMKKCISYYCLMQYFKNSVLQVTIFFSRQRIAHNIITTLP